MNDLSAQDEGPWFRRCLVGIEFGPTGANDRDFVYFSKASGAQIVELALKAQCEYIVLFCKDQNFSYYNSRVARKCPNLGERDLLRECLDKAQIYSLPVIAYVQVQYDTSSWLAHPEWRMWDLERKEIPGRLCFRSGYWDFIASVTDELMAYPIAGFHIDMLDFGFTPPLGCACPTCSDLFRRETGHPIPNEPTWDEVWDRFLEFRYRSNKDFCDRLVEHVRSLRPDVSIDFNYHGYPPFSFFSGQKPIEHGTYGDFITAEGLPWIFGHTNPSFLALFMQGVRPKGVRQGVTSRGVFDYHDFTVRPLAEMKWEIFTYLAHGSLCTIVDKAYYDGSLDREAFERIGAVFSEAQRKRPCLGHPPLQRVGIYFSSRTRDWWGKMEPQRYFQPILGAHKALLESHIPVGFLFDENVTLDRLKPFPVVYLANTAILTTEEVDLLTQYVRDGGNLLITGLTGCFGTAGERLRESPLAHLTGARLIGVFADHPDNYLRFPRRASQWLETIARNIGSDRYLLTYGPVSLHESVGAETYGEILTAHRSRDNPWQNHMSPDRPVAPALFFHRYGQGNVLLLPASLDSAYLSPYRQPEHRDLIASLIDLLDPEPPLRIQAPLNVEVVVTRDERRERIYVHFLAFWATIPATAAPFPEGKKVLPPLMEEELPYDAAINLRFPASNVWALDPRTQIKREAQRISIRIASAYEVVVIEGADLATG